MEQADFFASFEGKKPTPREKPAGIEVPKAEAEVSGVETDISRRDLTMGLTSMMLERPEDYQTLYIPRKLVQVSPFPLDGKYHNHWMATSTTEHFTIETGISEGCPELKPRLITVQDWCYILAIASILQNTEWNGRSPTFTTRHIGYITRGFPQINGRGLSSHPGLTNGKITKDIGVAMDKAYGRHLKYSKPYEHGSSAEGQTWWLTLLEYLAVREDARTSKGSAGKYYQDVALGKAFEYLAENDDDRTVIDLLMLFTPRKMISRAVLLFMTPRLLAGEYCSAHRPFQIEAKDLFAKIGAKPGTYRDVIRIDRNAEIICSELNGVKGALGRQLFVEKDKNHRGAVVFSAHMKKVSQNKAEMHTALRKTVSFSHWTDAGGREDRFLKRIFDARTTGVKFDADDREILDRVLKGKYAKHMQFLSLTKQLLGTHRFQSAIAAFKGAVLEGRTEATVPRLQGFINDSIRIAAGQDRPAEKR